MSDCIKELGNLLTVAVSKYAPENITEIENEITLILADYRIEKAETAIVEYSQAKNESFMTQFLVTKKIEGCTDNTLRSYSLVVWKILREIGKNADEITSNDLKIYLAKKQIYENVSKSYADTMRRYLRSFFSFLSDEELIGKNPCDRIPKIKQDKVRRKAFTEMEIEKLRKACKTDRERVIVEVLLSTACRVSELAQIRIDDIMNDKCVINGKGNKQRVVYFNSKAVLAIHDYLSDCAPPLIFTRAKKTRFPE